MAYNLFFISGQGKEREQKEKKANIYAPSTIKRFRYAILIYKLISLYF